MTKSSPISLSWENPTATYLSAPSLLNSSISVVPFSLFLQVTIKSQLPDDSQLDLDGSFSPKHPLLSKQPANIGCLLIPGCGVVTPGCGVVTPGCGVVTPGCGVLTPGCGVVTPGCGLLLEEDPTLWTCPRLTLVDKHNRHILTIARITYRRIGVDSFIMIRQAATVGPAS